MLQTVWLRNIRKVIVILLYRIGLSCQTFLACSFVDFSIVYLLILILSPEFPEYNPFKETNVSDNSHTADFFKETWNLVVLYLQIVKVYWTGHGLLAFFDDLSTALRSTWLLRDSFDRNSRPRSKETFFYVVHQEKWKKAIKAMKKVSRSGHYGEMLPFPVIFVTFPFPALFVIFPSNECIIDF